MTCKITKNSNYLLAGSIECLLAELPLKQAVKLTTAITGENKNTLYQFALDLKATGYRE